MDKVLFQEVQPERIYYQVVIEYQDCPDTEKIPEDERCLESETIGDLPRAIETARHTINKLQSMFPNTQVVELDLDEVQDGYHLLVVNTDNGFNVVKVGVAGYDYSEEKIH